MRLPRLRFTVRWLMAAVAVVAIALGVRAQLASERGKADSKRNSCYYQIVMTGRQRADFGDVRLERP
jgi:hypothetical protein